MDRNNEKPLCGNGARNAAKLAQKDPPASIGTEDDTHNLNRYADIPLEAILEPSNLKVALKRVVANRGGGLPGLAVWKSENCSSGYAATPASLLDFFEINVEKFSNFR